MSEELLQTIPQKVGKYTYHRLGSTTLDQLKNAGIIPQRDYGDIRTKRPDGLVSYQGRILAVVEYKQPHELRTDKDVENAIEQEIEVAKALCKVLIVTDSFKSYWVNALNGDFIRDSKGDVLQALFHPFIVRNVSTIEYLFDEIDGSINEENSTILSAKLVDPTPIATRLWQTIWVATGKAPIKCLYNVVELFIFKFLSDLEILRGDVAFDYLYQKAKDNPADALEFYARNSRQRIYRLFPKGTDGTTIIDGTIFVTESGEPNLSQSFLFFKCLDHLQRYSEEFGSLTKIDKQFKTKLYETFLKQEVQALGQYFTPRKVIQSVIRMAGIDDASFQYSDKRFCDPFCGVGGFPLEMLNMNERMLKSYTPDSAGEIRLPFVVHGFDKGFERDDERTIILAKANMLIYLAELLFASPSCTDQFAKTFNQTFTLFKDNLGTFGHIIDSESDKYDFILSNPPYVTSGSSIIKEEIQKTPATVNEYPVSGLGLESLSIEWVIKSLKPGGRSFLIIPDGILTRVNGKELRSYILRECFLEAIVSLPQRTFFANSKDTYILVITKKISRNDTQSAPVFTYLVSNIGERLTSVKREEIDLDDLPEMEALFRLFSGAPSSGDFVQRQSPRCKIFPFEKFRDSSHWVINRWWTGEERRLLEAESQKAVTKEEIDELLIKLQLASAEYDDTLMSVDIRSIPTREVTLGDTTLFRTFIGKRVIEDNVKNSTDPIPIYSANVFNPFGYCETSNVGDFTHASLLWGIDGKFDLQYIPTGQPFATTDHCGTVQILDHSIVPEYLLFAIELRKEEESFSRSFRASLTNMRQFKVEIPILQDGTFDIDAQDNIATSYVIAQGKERALKDIKQEFDEAFGRYVR